MSNVYIVGAKRTPIGSFQGVLNSIPAPRLGSTAIRAALEQSSLAPEIVDQVYMGCVLQANIGQAPARQAWIYAGYPVSTGAVTIHKVCGSGLKSVMLGANDIRAGEFSVVVAGGMESMSMAPYYLDRARDGYRMGHGQVLDGMIKDGLWDPYKDVHMGNCGELCAAEYGFTREEQDAFARQSYERALEAWNQGWFASEVVPVEVPQRKGDPIIVDKDEEPFRVSLDKMAKLKPAFAREGTITAANASKINDGAAALVLASEEVVTSKGLKPMARLVAQASHAQEPDWFTTAPAKAMQKVLDKAGLQAADVDLYEINEAFSVVTMVTMKELGLDASKVNIHGGAVAMGHPIGCSGARILTTLLYALQKNGLRYGMAGICIGGGEAVAVLVENLLR
ncbi:MAG TPA: thiolase family protein [Thermoanaerobaculia bacterium]|nr:thiolase family protein [Thermoanaerobaculia bacterium]HUM28625.1 thiolase family protein [Thermoanaerobaculia bacterium]HXK66767.1 thiolase family protein [Thermoanaerobaculia bacterium]